MISFDFQGAPHPPSLLMGDTWTKPYTREYAAFPAPWLRSVKFWPTTGNLFSPYPPSSFGYFSSLETHASSCFEFPCGFPQAAWTTSTVTATSSAPSSRSHRWRRNRPWPLRRTVPYLCMYFSKVFPSYSGESGVGVASLLCYHVHRFLGA